jgi:hypothetical protein
LGIFYAFRSLLVSIWHKMHEAQMALFVQERMAKVADAV